ncbi:MAG TPA: HD domain-containing protein, partial [Candidatus Peribacteraceae bacterium]|nr:HD domain-containing protein [Candidatus Peribacteraceae bacterium]
MALVAAYSARETFEKILIQRESSTGSSDPARLREAFAFAEREYGDRMHWTGETILEHCVGVLETFLRFDPDDDAFIATLLHHILDDKKWTLDQLEDKYGEAVRTMISGEYLLSRVSSRNKRMSIEDMRLMFLRVSGDLRLVLMLLSQQNHVLKRVEFLTEEDRKRVCRDTLLIYAPVAARLGIYWLKHEMEAVAFPVMYPTDAARIHEQLAHFHEKHGEFLENAAEILLTALKAAGLKAKVAVRKKQPYSIFHKMQLKSLSHVEDLYDLFALRVIVQTESECYQALGILHRIGYPVAGRFKDYIAFPKPNGYKSLHTTLVRMPGAPDGVFVEVQIRTADMQREADYGLAAHWSYKEGGTAEHAMRKAQVQQALEQPLENAKVPEFSDHIFVLTPQGDIVELPEGATPLDFAFYVHTALGLSFRVAKVNGVVVPLNYHLENGDVVEIQKHKNPRPSPRWMTLLKTASARSRLKRYLINHERPLYLAAGRSAMNRELAKHRLSPLDTDLTLLKVFDGKKLSFPDR